MKTCRFCDRVCNGECAVVGKSNICKDCLNDLRKALGIEELEKTVKILDEIRMEKAREDLSEYIQ